tara:strand:+ start:3587 stop:4180 length:594 start_codon:yes stop_codon:yes gene_type:complete
MDSIITKLKRKVYESRKARDILDEEFTQFGVIKRNINEFFDLYNNKFYDILKLIHQFFIEKSLQYIVDYINPRYLILSDLEDQLLRLQIEIGSIEYSHPIFKNNTVLHNTTDSASNWFIIQSGRRRKIIGGKGPLLDFIKQNLGHKDKVENNWAIAVSSNTISNIKGGPEIRTEEDLNLDIYTINTGKPLPTNIYIG